MAILFGKTKKMKKYLYILSLFACISAFAQTRTMGLKDCMLYALEHSTDMAIQAADNADKRIERRTAILSAFTPEISAGSSAYYQFGRSVDPETNTYRVETSFHNGYEAQAGIELFNGFQAIDNIKIARTSVAMGKTAEQQLRDKICLAVMEAYYNAVYYTKLTDNLRSQVETAKNSLDLAERQEELGQKGHADVIQIRADLADREYDLVNKDNLRKDALLTLQSLMLWPVEEELIINTNLSETEQTLIDYQEKEGIISKAIIMTPSALLAKGNLEIAKHQLHTAKWQLAPRLALYGGINTTYYTYPNDKSFVGPSFKQMLKDKMGEYIQIGITIPIYSGLSRQAKISKSRNEVRRAAARYDKAVKDVESEVMRALNDRDGAAAEFLSAERRADVQEEAYALNQRKFELGLISPIEYRSAADNYIKAAADKIGAQLRLRLKISVVNYYNGISYIDQL